MRRRGSSAAILARVIAAALLTTGSTLRVQVPVTASGHSHSLLLRPLPAGQPHSQPASPTALAPLSPTPSPSQRPPTYPTERDIPLGKDATRSTPAYGDSGWWGQADASSSTAAHHSIEQEVLGAFQAVARWLFASSAVVMLIIGALSVAKPLKVPRSSPQQPLTSARLPPEWRKRSRCHSIAVVPGSSTSPRRRLLDDGRALKCNSGVTRAPVHPALVDAPEPARVQTADDLRSRKPPPTLIRKRFPPPMTLPPPLLSAPKRTPPDSPCEVHVRIPALICDEDVLSSDDECDGPPISIAGSHCLPQFIPARPAPTATSSSSAWSDPMWPAMA